MQTYLQVYTETAATLAERILPPYLDPIQFLELFAPDRVAILLSAMSLTGFDRFQGTFIADMTLPPTIGGYYNCDPQNPVIAINPFILLNGSEEQIAHIIVHEGIHSGLYTDGVEVMEEVLTETMTKKYIYRLYRNLDFQSGYDQMVQEMQPYWQELSFEQLAKAIELEDEAAFDYFLELILINGPLVSNRFDQLRFQNIDQRLHDLWPMLRRLFPRMLNKIDGRDVGPHEQATLTAKNFELEGLLKRSVAALVEQGKLPELINQLLFSNQVDNLFDALELLKQQGLYYLYDFYPQQVIDLITDYLQSGAKLIVLTLDFQARSSEFAIAA
jgi:hypothetical protein